MCHRPSALDKTVTSWYTATGVYFMYPQWVEDFTATGGVLPGTPQKKTYRQHDVNFQIAGTTESGQYGNVTRVREYQGTTAYRQTDYLYFPNTTNRCKAENCASTTT